MDAHNRSMDPQKPPAKKRKLTDKALPSTILNSPTFSVDSQMYQSLLDMERKLDWTMMRKKAEVQDAMHKPISTTRTLRIFLSHTVSGQPWQQDGTTADAVNPETGEGIPAWQFKVEGRLLELQTHRAKDRTPPRKLSTFVKSMVIELDRDPAQYPDGNIVEWSGTNPQAQAPLDGFTVRRRGDATTKIRIIIHLNQYPEHYKVHPELGSILGIKEDTRTGVIHALWNYIKVHGLQDKLDRKTIKADAQLRNIFGAEAIPFQMIPERVNRFLLPPDPIILHYTLNPSFPPPEKPSAWDVELRAEDTNLKARMNHVVVGMTQEATKELMKIDEEIALQIQSLTNSHLKRTFLSSFAQNPNSFIETWLESQSRDLETALASGPSASMRQDDLRRSEFFRLPWVEEGVAIMEGMRLNAKAGY
ncbi:SWI/SNF complex 60 kDa subunit [Abortiporus biennis]|nr:SWI/SNF complex 60 kDa subunit [Abortiporus biennis]